MRSVAREDVPFGRYLVVPRGYHLVLASILTLLGLLVLVSSWVFFKKSITFMVGYVAFPLAVALGMWVQAVLRAQKKLWDRTSETTLLFIDIGTERLIGVVALVGALLTVIQAGILSFGLYNCPNWTSTSLTQLICGDPTSNCTMATDWTTLYRTPDFATNILTAQMCADDYALTIAYVVVSYVTVIVLVLVGIEQMMSRDQTMQLYIRMDLYKQREEAEAAAGALEPGKSRRVGEMIPLAADTDRPHRQTKEGASASETSRNGAVKILNIY